MESSVRDQDCSDVDIHHLRQLTAWGKDIELYNGRDGFTYWISSVRLR